MTFSNADLLPRRLSPTGCRLVGAQLQAHAAQVASENLPIPEAVSAALAAIAKATEPLHDVTGLAMLRVDRGADGCIANFARIIKAKGRCHRDGDVLPLTDAEVDCADAARRLEALAFPSGTGFLVKPQMQQYDVMTRLSTDLKSEAAQADIQTLGIALEVGHVLRWIELYGKRLGITQARDEDAEAIAIQAWHDAVGDLVAVVRVVFNDSRNPGHVRARELLLAPYDRQAEEERRRAVRSVPDAATEAEPE